MLVQQILDDTATKWPGRPALDFMGKQITYRELLDLVNRMAKGLQQLGVGPGTHVGLYLPNTPHYVIAFFGVLKAGGTIVNYSPLDAARELEHKIEDSRTDFLFTLDMASLYPQIAALLERTRLKKSIVGSLAEMAADRETVAAQMPADQQLCEVPQDSQHIRFSQLLDNDGQPTRPEAIDPASVVAVLQYTGGTTGQPKGAMLTHTNLSCACMQAWRTVTGVLYEGEERILAVLPPFHIYAITVNMLMGIRGAAELVMHLRFDAEKALSDIENKKITMFPGVPTMFTALLNHPAALDHNLSSLKHCGSGGAPLPLESMQRFSILTGTTINEGWGMTETSGVGTFTPIRGLRKAGSCGIPLSGVEIKLLNLNELAEEVPIGERGELCIRGPNVMKEYWNAPQATADATTIDGFFRTGDVATMDADGFVTIVDRTKDMLICSGFNVYPRNIEEAIYEHMAVAEVCVIGIPDSYRGQSPKAFVKLRKDATVLRLEELQAFLSTRLGKHEMIRALEIRTELPKTAVGKLSKAMLYEEEAKGRTQS